MRVDGAQMNAGHAKSPYSEAESRQASAKIWTIYIAEAERYDRALVESWKADMEGILIFVRSFRCISIYLTIK
jgi:hypothetical protein